MVVEPTGAYSKHIPKCYTPKFNCLPLKNDGWKMILSFWDGLFSGFLLLVSRSVVPSLKLGIPRRGFTMNNSNHLAQLCSEVIIVDWDDTLFPTSWLSPSTDFDV